MDFIHLNGLRCYGYIGYLPEEKVLGQWFEVDARLGLDLAAAGQSDRLGDTIDYREAIACIQEVIKTSQADLVESVAETIAAALLRLDRVVTVRVRLTKPHAPIPDYGGKIVIEIERSQPIP